MHLEAEKVNHLVSSHQQLQSHPPATKSGKCYLDAEYYIKNPPLCVCMSPEKFLLLRLVSVID